MGNEAGSLLPDIESFLRQNQGELSAISGNLLSAAGNREVRTLLITSAHPREGKTIAAVSMAVTLATQVNSRVLLIDANFKSPGIHEIFRLNQSPGLSEVLLSDLPYGDAARRTEYENLMVLPCGSSLTGKFDVKESELLRKKLATLRDNFDHVIVDAHSLSRSSDVSLIAKFFDGVILVIECEQTRWQVVQQAKETIESLGGRILGTVLNKRRYYIPKKLYGMV